MMAPVTKRPGDSHGFIHSERSQSKKNTQQQILTKSFILGNLNKGKTQYYKNPYAQQTVKIIDNRLSLVKQPPKQSSTERRQSNNYDSLENQLQHSRSIQLQENTTLTQSMNVIFNKNERIISGKASHFKPNNLTSLSRNLQRSQLGAQSKNNNGAGGPPPQNTFNKTLNGSQLQHPSPQVSRNLGSSQLIKSSLGFAKTQNTAGISQYNLIVKTTPK